MRLGVEAAVVGGAVVPGDVDVEDGRVAAVGAGAGVRGGGTAVPGFVDVQVNGFDGIDYLEADAGDVERAARALAATGVTAHRPTLISAPPEEMERALRAIGGVQESPGVPRILGAHLEGPFLSPAWPGAHPPEHLRLPDVALVGRLRAAGPIGHVTLAPELPGALDLIRSLVAAGITVAIGHTDAGAATAHAAFAAGARALTHVHNAHRRFAPRDPGPAGVALVRRDATVTAIVDHVHLAPETAGAAWRAARGRFCLVTDAMAAAGRGPGTWPLGGGVVTVDRDGEARLADGRLAGSTLTMVAALRNLAGLGATLPEAVHAASRAGALLAGRPDLGTLEPGAPADVAVLDAGLRVTRTLVGGVEAFAG